MDERSYMLTYAVERLKYIANVTCQDMSTLCDNYWVEFAPYRHRSDVLTLRWAHSAQYNVHQAQAAHRKAMDQQDRSSRACGEVVSDNMGMYGELHSSLEARHFEPGHVGPGIGTPSLL